MIRTSTPTRHTTGVAILLLATVASTANATVNSLVDFELWGTAHGERSAVDTMTIDGVDVTFSISGFSDLPVIAMVGNDGTTNNRLIGFQNMDEGADTPNQQDTDDDPQTIAGPSPDESQYFLTNTNRPFVNRGDYVIDFSQPVRDVSLLVYDFNADGNIADGIPGTDTVYLRGYLGESLIATDAWTVPLGRAADGVVVQLGFTDIVDRVIVELDGSDFGTGIDNVSFSVVPEPAAGIFGAIGLFSLFVRRRRSA